MPGWHTINLADVSRLYPALESAVEMRTDYGREKPDWDLIISDVEESESGLDLGQDMHSPVIRKLMKHGRRIYLELREQETAR